MSLSLNSGNHTHKADGREERQMTRHILTIAALAGIWVSTTFAGVLYWDANGATAGTGGTGDWNTTDTTTWRNGSAGGTQQAWVNQNNAVFGGTAGTVTLKENITVGNGSVGDILKFDTWNYIVNADPGVSLTIKAPTSGRNEPFYGRNTTINAPLVLDAGTNSVVFRNEGGNVTINGNISGTGGFWPWQQEGNTSQKTILSGNNTFSGGVSGYVWGALVVGSNTALGTGALSWGGVLEAGPSNPTVANTVNVGNDARPTFIGTNSLTFSADQIYQSYTHDATGCSGINVQDAGGTLTFKSLTEMRGGGVLTWDGWFTKLGNGTLVISGDYSCGGVTTVSAGTLILNGATYNADSPNRAQDNYIVAAGAKLGGTGTIWLASGKSVTLNAGTGTGAANWGGTLTPGKSPGLLTINGNLDVNNFAAYLFEPGATPATSDSVTVTGALSFLSNPTVIVKLARMMGDPNGQSWTLFTYGSTTGTPTWLVDTSGTGWVGGSVAPGVGNTFVLSGLIPEPASLALLALAGAALASRRRR